jgi:hypothetical protein
MTRDKPMKLLMIMAAILLLASCGESKNWRAADRQKAIDQGTSVGERLACGCPGEESCAVTDCPPVFDSLALRHYCRAVRRDGYAMVFLNKDPSARRLAVAKESCECFVATHAIMVKGFAKERAELAAEVRCSFARQLLSKEKP